MSRIERTFSSLRAKEEKALVIYLTAGDPSLEKTREIVLGLDAAGVDCLEIGVPFSDPTADGPIRLPLSGPCKTAQPLRVSSP